MPIPEQTFHAVKDPLVKVLLTCEHGGNEIPPEYAEYFKGAEAVLATHRGYDIGALELFKKFKGVADFSLSSTTSRLVVELNRSLHHAQLFSEFMQGLPPQETEKVLANYYQPYRQKVEEQVAAWVEKGGQVLHVSVHSFTPELAGKDRKADIGFLYDPKREREQLFAAQWRQQLQEHFPEYKIRYNYPYKGTADGFVTQLRKQYANDQYAGLELEVNQRFPATEPAKWQVLQKALVQSFERAL
ncbi:N-formylglutamate amidohydrolase [Rufibacter soli]